MTASHVRRGAGLVAGISVLFVGLMGFAHTHAGRPLLAAIGRVSGRGSCPLGYDKKMSPADRERARAAFAAGHRGTERAAARPALGFVLDQTPRAEVVSLMAAQGVTCQTGQAMADLVCAKVPSGALPAAFAAPSSRELWFTFGGRQQLISLIAMSRDTQAPAISEAFDRITATVGKEAGPPTARNGDSAPLALAAGALVQASAEFRFTNYYASARATNMGHDFLLTEEYRSLPN